MSDVGGRPPAKIEGAFEEIEKLAKLGCTLDEIAEFFDCTKRTVQRYISETEEPGKSEPGYREAWQRGRIAMKHSLRRLQIRHASGEGNAAVQMTIHMSKHHLGESEKSLQVHMNPDGSPIESNERQYVVILPHNNRDPLPEEARVAAAQWLEEEAATTTTGAP